MTHSFISRNRGGALPRLASIDVSVEGPGAAEVTEFSKNSLKRALFSDEPFGQIQKCQLCKHRLAYALAMNPFLLFDLLNRHALGCVLYGFPVAAIREACCQLARVRSLKNLNEMTAMVLVIR